MVLPAFTSTISFDEDRSVGSNPICLRIRYAMSGTDLAYAAIIFRRRYAMSGTDVGYAATRRFHREAGAHQQLGRSLA
eukprot:246122-Rhodomonas_salina.2